MRISPISNSYYQRFKASSDEIESQTRQAIKENMKSIEQEAYNNVSSKINNRYKSEFMQMINSQSKKVNPNDVKCILGELQQAYTEAGLSTDADAISAHLKTMA